MEITISLFVRSVGGGQQREEEDGRGGAGNRIFPFSTRNPGNCFCFPKKSGVKNPPWVDQEGGEVRGADFLAVTPEEETTHRRRRRKRKLRKKPTAATDRRHRYMYKR